MKLLLLIFLTGVTAAQASDSFHAYVSSTNLIEGGQVETMILVTPRLQTTLRPPRNWSHQVDELQQRVTFENRSGQSALIVQFTTNSPGALPDKELLKERVLGEHPGSGILQYSVCATSSGPGVFFDLVRMPAPHVMLLMRQAFIALPSGQAEVTLSASDDEFATGRTVMMGLLNSFRDVAVKPKVQ